MVGGDKVQVLQILIGGKTFSGIASYLYQQYKYIDRDKINYDFLFCKENSMKLRIDEPIFTGSKFIELNAKSKKSSSNDYIRIFKGVDKALNEKKYDVVVINTSVIAVIAVCMKAVEKHKGIYVIPHAHNTEIIIGKKSIRNKLAPITRFVDNCLRHKINKKATYLFACSKEAGVVTYGPSVLKNGRLMIIKNAINLESFKFDQSLRDEVRAEENIAADTLVVGNVGKLTKRKNQIFLVYVFNELLKRHSNAKLWLIGEGNDRDLLEQTIHALGVENKVCFMGQRADVNRVMQGMDIFVFPSISEGLGIVAIEAQAAGLPVIVSDGVPEDVMVSNLIKRVSLVSSAEEWARVVLEQGMLYKTRGDITSEIVNAGYDIQSEVKKIEGFYMNIVSGNQVLC